MHSVDIEEALMTPERFANIYADDIDSPHAKDLVPLIAQAIRLVAASIFDA
jgi:hypothetical protein